MSVLIKGMLMPENCVVCPMAENIPPGRTRCLLTRRLLADNYNPPAYERNEHCPLVDLGKHGDLIDRDELKKEFPKDTDWEYPVNTNQYVCETIDEAKTVVEAEGE